MADITRVHGNAPKAKQVLFSDAKLVSQWR